MFEAVQARLKSPVCLRRQHQRQQQRTLLGPPSLRLFIKQANSPPRPTAECTIESQANKQQHSRPSERRGETTTTSGHCISQLLVVAVVCMLALGWPIREASGQQHQRQQQHQHQESEIRPSNMPTVIVRGFLNYRTTVDGTVLLFTPDAGGASQSATVATSNQQAIVSSTPALVSSTSVTFLAPRLEPTSVRPAPSVATTFYPTSDEGLTPVGHSPAAVAAAGDEWRPIQATPPLRATRPTVGQLQPQSAPAVGDGSVTSEANRDHATAAAMDSSTTQPDAGQAQRSSRPSVQADDVLLADSPHAVAAAAANRPAQFATSPFETPSSSPSTPIGGHSRATRPKRPSLGFTGQGVRGGIRQGNRAQNSNQAEAQSTNTINGIRRPGLSTTTSTTPAPDSAETAQSGPASPTIGAFQSRLANASAKMRNRFKRPPIGGANGGSSGVASPSAVSAPTTAQSAALVQPPQVATSESDLIATPTTGDQVVPVGSIVAASPTTEQGAQAAAPAGSANVGSPQPLVSTETNNSADRNSLQPRMGDIFNPGASIGISPVVGSDEILSAAAASRDTTQHQASTSSQPAVDTTGQKDSSPQSPPGGTSVSLEPVFGGEFPPEAGAPAEGSDGIATGARPTSRLGEQRPRHGGELEHQLPSGGVSGPIEGSLQQGLPLNFDNFFQSDQPPAQAGAQPEAATGSETSASENRSSQANPTSAKRNNNDKLNGWLDKHHNKFVPRPPGHHHHDQSSHMSHQLAASLNSLAPSFVSNIPPLASSSSAASQVKPSSVAATATQPLETSKPTVGGVAPEEPAALPSSPNGTADNAGGSPAALQMQTITKTYSTVMTSSKTRLVPLQVKSSTAIHTITEHYVITKMLTAYQTMPMGEFILPEPLSTRAPFEMFNELTSSDSDKSAREQPVVPSAPSSAGSNHVAPAMDAQPQQEQPISLDPSPKSANDWLHDFSNTGNNNMDSSSQTTSNGLQQQQAHNLAALLERQAQEANLAGFSLGEPLDQLASSLDPAALLADGAINIPDLNNPLVLAAAIQNPQLAAVILAAQQLQLKQRQNKLNGSAANQQQQQLQPAGLQQLQPSYSTSLSTAIRPSIYTVRDTMYTTRLVSFKDGRTMRTRTVSEPGSVIEQVLTTMATEITPVTITIRPTGMLTLPSSGQLATMAPSGQQPALSSQTTLNNALFATQLAGLLARRQQQAVQPSGNSALFAAASNAINGGGQSANQLAALQQLIGQQQQRQQQQQQAPKQFQPNLQQLLQSMQQQQQQQPLNPPPPASTPSSASGSSNNNKQAGSSQESNNSNRQQESSGTQPTPPLPVGPTPSLPITTTLTNLQVRTYTVHNAFKTIYRTITSTQLITSTILPAARNTALPNMG